MSYIGNNLQVAYPSYTNIDDISGSFDSVTTSFALTVGGVAPVPAPLSSNQCMISVGGVIQRPDDTGTEGFRLSGGNIVFSSAPNTGEDFFGVILAGADYVNVGVNFPSGSASTPSITFDSDLDTGLYNPAANELGITTAGTSRLVVDSSGNVNIDSNTLYVDAVNNRVGVGTTSPSVPFHVSTSATNTPGLLEHTASVDSYLYIKNSTGGAYIASRTNDLSFHTSAGATERARIDSSGRLLVGTSTSLATYLTQINFAGASTNGLYVNSSSTSGDGSTMIALGRASTPNNTVPVITYTDSTAGRFQLRNNGGLANYQANNVNLSDRNAKKDISPAADTWDCIKEWEIVNYRYKDQPDDADLNLGVIAQQVAESCPEVITVFEEAKDDQPEKLGVKEQQMYWMAIKALQEAQVRIEQLEAKVAALETL